jgi:hypothetical protein
VGDIDPQYRAVPLEQSWKESAMMHYNSQYKPWREKTEFEREMTQLFVQFHLTDVEKQRFLSLFEKYREDAEIIKKMMTCKKQVTK